MRMRLMYLRMREMWLTGVSSKHIKTTTGVNARTSPRRLAGGDPSCKNNLITRILRKKDVAEMPAGNQKRCFERKPSSCLVDSEGSS